MPRGPVEDVTPSRGADGQQLTHPSSHTTTTPSLDVGTSGFGESQQVRAVRRQQGLTLTRLWVEPPATLGPRQLVEHVSRTHHRYTHV